MGQAIYGLIDPQLPLDDSRCLTGDDPHLTRSSIASPLPATSPHQPVARSRDDDKIGKTTFKAYLIGYFHVALAEVRTEQGNAVRITIEDEREIANILLWARLFEMQRRAVMASRLMVVEDEIQRSKEGVIHLMATRVHDRSAEMDRLTQDATCQSHPHARSASHPRNVRILPGSRDFHRGGKVQNRTLLLPVMAKLDGGGDADRERLG